MKKIKKILLFAFFLIIFFEGAINLLLHLYKRNLQKSFFQRANLESIYYIFPNIFFISNIEFSSSNYSVYVKNSFFYLDPFKVFKKGFIIHSIKAKNIYLEILDLESKNFKNLDAESISQSIFELLSFLPSKISVKNGRINYKGQVISIDKITKTAVDKQKSLIHVSGKWNRYNFDLNINISSDTWFAKGKIFLPDFGIGVNNIDVDIFGDYDFKKLKNYVLRVNRDNTNYLVVKGNINFLIPEITGDIDTSFGRAKVVTVKEGRDFKVNFNSSFNLKLPKLIVDKIALQNIKTDLFLVISSSGYNIQSKIYLQDTMLDFNIKDNKGRGYLVSPSFKHKVPFDIVYKNKNLFIYNTQSKYPLNLKLDFSKKDEFLISGKLLGYSTYVKLCKCFESLKLDSSFLSDQCEFKFDYVNYVSSSSIKFIYVKGKTTHLVFNSVLKDDKLSFTVTSKNLNIEPLDDIKFSAKGEIRRAKKDKNYYLSILLDNLYYKQYKVLESLPITGKFDRKNIDLTFGEKLFYGSLSYDILKNYGYLSFNVDSRQFKIDKFQANLVCNLKLENKQGILNLEGTYRIKSLLYDGQKVLDFCKGEIMSSLNNIISKGEIFIGNNNVNYDVIYSRPSKQLMIKAKNVNFLPNVKKFELFNVELTSEIDDSYSFKNLTWKGKIYNDNSEVIISSFNVSFIEDVITAYCIIKNLKIKNFNFTSNVELFIKDFSKRWKSFKLYFDNLWINEHYADKVYLSFVYNAIDRELIFLHDDSELSKSVKFSGKICFFKNYIKFLDFKISDKTSEYLTCTGNVGIDNEALRIKISGIPLNLIKNCFQIPLHNINGIVFSNIKLLTIDSDRNLYQMSLEFLIDDVDIETLKLKNILGKMTFYRKNLNIENIDFVFKENKKMNLRGSFNFDNKTIDMILTSHNCDLSILNGFQNIIRSANGKLMVSIKATGSLTSPNIVGYLNVTKGRIEFDEYLKYIENLNINLVFNEKGIRIDKFFGSYENTTFSIGGRISLTEGYSIRLKTSGGDGIFVKIPELSFPVGQFFKIIKGEKLFPSNGNVHLDITIVKRKSQPPMVTGDIILNNAHFTYPGISSKRKISSLGFYHNLNLIANNNVWYENEYLSANISGKINFCFNEGMQKMNINGEAIALRGKINFLNHNFDLTSGKLEIIDRNVYIQLTGETKITTPEREIIPINLVIERSKIEEIKPKLVSPMYPELKTEEITSLLLGVGRFQRVGDKVSIISTEKIDYLPLLRAQFIRMIDTTFATPIAKNILKRWGIADNFSIVSLETSSSSFDAEQKNSGSYNKFKVSDIFKDTKYVIEKYITSDMLVSYSIAFAEIQNKLNLKHEIEISYRLKNNVFIKGLYDYSIRDYTNRYTPNVSIMIQPIFKFKSWSEEEKE